jgi:hypothetical protein
VSDFDDTIRWVYDHLRATLDRDERAHELYVLKARHLVGLTVALFAVVSFGLSKTAWALGSGHQDALFILAASAGSSLSVAFFAGLACLRIEYTPVVGVTTLRDSLKSGEIHKMTTQQVSLSLATNLAQAILDDRHARKQRGLRARLLNWFLAIGTVLTVVFIGYSLGGDALTALQPPSTGSNTMSESPYESNQPSETPPQSAPLVEPSDHVQTSEPAPPPASLLEPSDIIQKSDDRPIMNRGGDGRG